jgi:CxxC-x17-CxxC domain-containing protein
MGKTTLLENMAIQDIRNGKGLAIIDPHGEFAERMLDFVPKSRTNEVIYFNPADLAYPIPFNIMGKTTAETRPIVASGIMGVFKKIWPDVWSARMEYILNNTILGLLEVPGTTLLGIMRMLENKDYRENIIEKLKDPIVKSFWVDQFGEYHKQFATEAIAPIQNKVGQFLSNPLIRNIVGNSKSALDMREIMDKGKILICNLSKGRIGEDATNLLGGLLVTKLYLAAMSRVDIPESERKDFYFYVDEFQNFATEGFANILSEARKYRLSLILAHQYIDQLRFKTSSGGQDDRLRSAVLGNVGTLISFRIGAEDAECLEEEFKPEVSAGDLINLSKYHIYLKLTIDGVTSDAFSAVTLPPCKAPEVSYKDKVIELSRERNATLKEVIEEKIARWSGVIPRSEESGTAAPQDKQIARFQRKSQKQISQGAKIRHFARCAVCGANIKIPFKPDPSRPVYCKNCLSEAQTLKGQRLIPSLDAYIIYKKGQEVTEKAALTGAKEPDKSYQSLAELKKKLEENRGELRKLLKRSIKKRDGVADDETSKEEKLKELKAGQAVEL